MKRFVYLPLGLLGSLLSLSALAQTAASSAAPAPAAASDSVIAAPVANVLTGTVLGARDQPLAGASVSVVTEPNLAGVTNSAGGFVLRSMESAPRVRVSYAGYEGTDTVASYSQPLVLRLVPINKYAKNLKKRAKTAEKEYRKP